MRASARWRCGLASVWTSNRSSGETS
jgi:hypothetical protein